MKSTFIGLLALGLACVFGPSIKGAVIVNYTFAGSSANPTTEDPNASAGAFANGPGISTMTFSTSTGSPTQPSIAIASSQISTSFDPDDYVGFTVTADSGYALDLSSLSFAYSFDATTSSATIFGSWFVRSSVDGFASNLATYTRFRTAGASWITTDPAVDLSALAFSSLSNVEFRIYLTKSEAATQNFRMDNIILDGSVIAVPEPATWGLLLLGGTVLWGRRRKSRS